MNERDFLKYADKDNNEKPFFICVWMGACQAVSEYSTSSPKICFSRAHAGLKAEEYLLFVLFLLRIGFYSFKWLLSLHKQRSTIEKLPGAYHKRKNRLKIDKYSVPNTRTHTCTHQQKLWDREEASKRHTECEANGGSQICGVCLVGFFSVGSFLLLFNNTIVIFMFFFPLSRLYCFAYRLLPFPVWFFSTFCWLYTLGMLF